MGFEIALCLFVCAFATLNLILNHFISKRLDAQSARLDLHFKFIQEVGEAYDLKLGLGPHQSGEKE